MLKTFIIKKYLAKEFVKIVINTSLIFFSLGIILSLFEEINFFKDYDVGMNVPIVLSILFVPSLLYNMFPFVFLIAGIWFFLKIKKNDEITAMKVSGMSNFSVIIVPGVIAVLLGIFFVTTINPITSVMVKKYESIKGGYEKEKESLAAVTVNGIWIKEKSPDKNFIIQSSTLEDFYLKDVSIYEFDSQFNFIRRIESDKANVTTTTWKLYNPLMVDNDGKTISDDLDIYYYKSLYNIDQIKNLYSNLDTVSFWAIKKELKLLEERGYSTNDMRAKMHRSFAFPLFLLSMVLLSGVFTLGMNFKENNWTYVFIAIITSVLVFYFNDFSSALGKTDKLSVEISVWMPIVIIFIFSAVGMLHANQK